MTFPVFVRIILADEPSFDDSGIAGLEPGRVVLLVGPSGAGKDAVLLEVRRRLASCARFKFPRRVVTRQPSAAEDHDCVSAPEFLAQLKQGRFALHWQAHGLSYGIPVEIDAWVCGGGSVVCNASRSVIARARTRYRHAAVVLIDAPAELRARRLANRGRERANDLAARLARASDFQPADAELVIENTGPLTAAVGTLLDWLLAWGYGTPSASRSGRTQAVRRD